MSQLFTSDLNEETKVPAVLAPGIGIGNAQLARLFRIILLLQSRRYPNARDLAEFCEVSRRTIYRDLELLGEAGVSVRFRQDRQGYELAKGFFLLPLGLEEREAFSLLVLARKWSCNSGLGLPKLAFSGALKLMESLPAEARERAFDLAEPFLGEAGASESWPEREAIHEAIIDALTRQRQLRLWYYEQGSQVEECTKFAIYKVLLHGDFWYLVGRSSLHRRIQVIGVPWVRRAVLTDEPFVPPVRFNLDRFLGRSWGVERSLIRYRVCLLFSTSVAMEVAEYARRRGLSRTELDDGRLELRFVVEGLEELLRWVLGFGDQVEVLSPAELRQRVFEVAENLSRTHAEGSKCGHPRAVVD